MLKDQIIPKGCDARCVNSTIINRAYFSSYLFCELWLDYVKNFRPIPLWEFGDDENKINEHSKFEMHSIILEKMQ